MQPYQLVKDLRNKIENTNPISVLDGNIDQFIEEELKIDKIDYEKNFYFFFSPNFIFFDFYNFNTIDDRH